MKEQINELKSERDILVTEGAQMSDCWPRAIYKMRHGNKADFNEVIEARIHFIENVEKHNKKVKSLFSNDTGLVISNAEVNAAFRDKSNMSEVSKWWEFDSVLN